MSSLEPPIHADPSSDSVVAGVRWDAGSRCGGGGGGAHRERFSRQAPGSPTGRDAHQTSPSASSASRLPQPASQTITEALLAERKMTLGNFLYLFFSPPSGSELRAGGPGQPSTGLKAPGQRSFLCRVMVTPTDIFFEQIPTDKHLHGEATLGATVTHTASAARLHPPPPTRSQRGGLAFPSASPPLEEDVFCVPRTSLLHVSTFQGSRVRGAVGVCLHTRSFQCLYLLFFDPLDQENLLQELRAGKGRLTDRAFSASATATATPTGLPRDGSTALPCLELASPAVKLASSAPTEPTAALAEPLGEVYPMATPVTGLSLWGGTSTAEAQVSGCRPRELSVGLRLLRLSAQRSEAAAYATLAGIHVVPKVHLRAVAAALNGAYADRSAEPQQAVNPKWFACDIATEFQRQQFSDHWRLTQANSRFALCDSYPPVLIVPSRAADDFLLKAAASRTRARLLVATYYHKPTGATIVRGAQPKGADMLIRNFMETPTIRYSKLMSDTCPSGRIRTFDLRPKTNAVANVFHGGGFESGEGVSFANLGNITQVRGSYMKLFALIHPTTEAGPRTPAQVLAALAETGWLDVVHMILSAAVDVAKTVSGYGDRPAEIAVVHCSDGWDRTSQVAALAQILLDPFFRTIKGLCILIDKDFIQFGHMFATRSACFGGDAAGWLTADQHAPIFFLFADCLRILLKLHPESFEYNEDLLLLLLDLFHSGVFGNFAFNSYAEILQASATRTTPSLWTFLEHLLRVARCDGSSGSSRPESSLSESHSDERRSSEQSPDASSTSEPFSKVASPTQPCPPDGARGLTDLYVNPFYNPDESGEPLTLEVRELDVDLWRGFFLRYPARSSAGAPSFRPPEKLSSRSSSVGDSAGRSTPLRGADPTTLGRPLTPQYPKRQPPGFTSRQTQSCVDLPALMAAAATRNESTDPSPSSLPRSASNADHALATPTNPVALAFPTSPVQPDPPGGGLRGSQGGFARSGVVQPWTPEAVKPRVPANEEDEFASDLNDGAPSLKQQPSDPATEGRGQPFSLLGSSAPIPPSSSQLQASAVRYSETFFPMGSGLPLTHLSPETGHGAAAAQLGVDPLEGSRRTLEAAPVPSGVGCHCLLDEEWFEV